ncbi:ABC transporter substrate-binding protein [Bifidobacterium sp. 82T10]|uniref:ABC transporter substrate-binding protein n=1 Tax=Bifidobacterium miconis TaxID=2834435 RepID=A0ABS6WEM9_9BIFI|nr:ABC transporter substrate-binding protein [Bifidobacterium miconis]MBW3092059.1 ABC transporter substrate-binding protein [Bifidobacterium miconis]
MCCVSLGACGNGGNSAKGGASKTLTIDQTFALSSMDPQRAFEATGYEVNHSVYETALTYKGSDLTKIEPSVTTYKMNDDNTVLTLTMNGEHKFSDGKTVTVDDIVYSYQRLQAIKGNPSYLLDGITVKKVDDKSLTLTAKSSMPQMPSILVAPPLSIVEKSVVEKNGGKLSPEDGAEKYLTDNSVGSGPYMYDKVATDSSIILKRNPYYTGDKPYYDRIVLNNVAATSQKMNLEGGNADIAENISQDESSKMDSNSFAKVSGMSLSTWFLSFNTYAPNAGIAANTDFVSAMKHAIDYDKILELIGPDTQRPAGLIPFSISGAIKSDPNLTYDPAKAKEYLAKSGYDGSEVKLIYSDETAHLSEVAQLVQSDVKKVGINIKLDPQTPANRLSQSRENKTQISISNWGADYPDPANYVSFLPADPAKDGETKGWSYGKSDTADAIKPYAEAAENAKDEDSRIKAYEDLQHKLDEVGPYIPLYQPSSFVMIKSSLKNVTNNGIWGIDYAAVSA